MKKIEIINQWDIDRIFQELEQGNMRIPRFQREYVWERSKIVKLLNSISKSYPIGSFFLWETDTSMEALVRNVAELNLPTKPQSNQFKFILDGQQRITSLYVALKGKILNDVDYSTICYNLEKKEFLIPRLKTEQHNIPVWKIWDGKEFNKLLKQYASAGEELEQQTDALMNCKDLLTSYPISVIMSREMEVDEVIDIFERINQGGKRLSMFDLVNAATWKTDFDLREEIDTFWSEPNVKQWGWIGYEIYSQSLALNLKSDCTKLVQLKMKADECQGIWERTKECIRLTIDYLKTLGAQHISILPYANIIPIIQYYLYKSNYKTIQPQHRQLIEDWFWTVTFSKRYSSSTLTRMNEDIKWIDDLLAGKLIPRIYSINLKAEDLRWVRMNNASVIKNGILCLMARNHPLDFNNGQPVALNNTQASRSNSKENHHFFPFSQRSVFGVTIADINSVLNFAFITKHLNGEISNRLPSQYLASYEALNPDIVAHLETHYITPTALAAAKKDDFNAFIGERGKTIMALIDKVCKKGVLDASPIFNDDDIDDQEDSLESGEYEMIEKN